MGKLPILFLLLAVAMLAAACFGALHNQITYTVGPTYVTEFKFRHFGIGLDAPPRLGAAYVGIMASWWMGSLIGLLAFLFGLFAVPNGRSYLAAGLGAIFMVILLASISALAGLLGGIAADKIGLLDAYLTFPEGPTRSDLFRAGFMHDASYLAGALGLIAAFFPTRRARQIDLHRTRQEILHAT